MTKPEISSDLPMVKDPTRAQSENIQTVVSRMESGRIVIPDYQRDAEQWDARKESLFIESLLNNLTIPAFFFAEQEAGKIEVVDGQQRLSTILKFKNEKLTLSNDEEMVYLTPQSAQYRNKNYKQIPEPLRNVFDDYPLTIIYLPKNLALSAKLEIFRRINEGGTPLSPQDIRLSYYSESQSVTFIRLAGIYSDTDAAKRMLSTATKHGIENPWKDHVKAHELWSDWWADTVKAKGQTPSEMFLWYLVQRHRENINALVSTPDTMKHLPLGFRGTSEEVLDIFCAQLLHSDKTGGKTKILPTHGKPLEKEFDNFIQWIEFILGHGLTGMGVDKYKQMALFIGAAVELKLKPQSLTDDQWDAISEFIRTPRHSGAKWLKKVGYPEPKGRWGGDKGQKAQCDSTIKLISEIVKAG
ncbi:DUF262 domain-containing protein [Corallococcus sp. CA047B]|uniref:DUF262 domain-containing protein n=1 Tax=Corallococcus sp. CA047B TaxID=2316729 RepID=UPI000EA0A0AC|nr:DUF262 domain-containing protein [Corallococcus sp. CA047B]RKH05737.1 DUF262 domain-containing protein [Corallococcus sp. CA047B]